MAKMILSKDSEKYVSMLQKLSENSDVYIGKAIYLGAGVVADEIKKNIHSLPILKPGIRGSETDPIDGVTSVQKEGLIESMGIAKLKNENGFYNVKVGFDGYNRSISLRAKKAKWKNTKQANSMIARSVESGTSFRKKHPFVAPAVKKTQKAAEEKIKMTLETEIEKLGF